MSDLISRQDAIDTAIEAADEWDGGYSRSRDEIITMKLQTLPSGQPKIIHCKDCKHWKNKHLCECLSRYGTFETPEDFFCGYGKEK